MENNSLNNKQSDIISFTIDGNKHNQQLIKDSLFYKKYNDQIKKKITYLSYYTSNSKGYSDYNALSQGYPLPFMESHDMKSHSSLTSFTSKRGKADKSLNNNNFPTLKTLQLTSINKPPSKRVSNWLLQQEEWKKNQRKKLINKSIEVSFTDDNHNHTHQRQLSQSVIDTPNLNSNTFYSNQYRLIKERKKFINLSLSEVKTQKDDKSESKSQDLSRENNHSFTSSSKYSSRNNSPYRTILHNQRLKSLDKKTNSSIEQWTLELEKIEIEMELSQKFINNLSHITTLNSHNHNKTKTKPIKYSIKFPKKYKSIVPSLF